MAEADTQSPDHSLSVAHERDLSGLMDESPDSPIPHLEGDGQVAISHADSQDAANEPHGNGVALEKRVEVEGNEAGSIAGERDTSEAIEASTTELSNDEKEKIPTGPTKLSNKGHKPLSTAPGKLGKSDAPPTPLVKKIINSGTFGSGAVKPSPPSVSKTSGTPSTTTSKPVAAAPLKKSTSGSSTATSKPSPTPVKPTPARPSSTTAKSTMTNSRSATSSALSSSTATRRQSLAPKNNSAPTKPGPPSYNATKPTSTTTTTTTVVRPTSPDPLRSSANRPRASVSDGLPARRATVGPRPSVPNTPKPPLIAGTRPVRTAGSASISSLKEVKEDETVNKELQNKLAEALSSVASKSAQVTELQSQLESLKLSLETAVSDAESKRADINQLEQEKEAAIKELQEVKGTLDNIRGGSEEAITKLQLVDEQLRAAHTDSAKHSELVGTLQDRIQALTSELETVKENLSALRASNDAASSESAAAAQVEHEALLKAKADLEAIQSETAALSAVHAKALDDAAQRVQELESKVALVVTLDAELTALKTEKEETASKVSELEIEILELKEAAEKAEEQRARFQARMQSSEEDLAKVTAAVQQAADDAKVKGEEHAQQLIEIKRFHDEALQTASEERGRLSSQLKSLEEGLADATARHEQALADAQVSEVDHAHKLEEMDKLHVEKHSELIANIQRLESELQGQETQYAAKVDAVKAEHDQLLQQAFETAKTAAGEVHTQDLQTLRSQSHATIEQLRTAHQSNMDELIADHKATLESQAKSLEKTISNQSLELKATQDDLAKAKSALVASLPEFEALKAQLKEATQAASSIAASSSAEHDAEFQRLNRELAIARDDLAVINDVLKATKDSMAEMSNNHGVELEMAAQTRADEVTKLKAAHEEEKSSLLQEKDALASRLSDLEGELATLRATSAAEPTTSPKSNGVAPAGPPSVTKEELQRLHEAHNLKVHDMEAEHERTVKGYREEVDATRSKSEQLQSDVTRREMEIKFLEQEGEEKDDTITRLKEDLATFSDQLEQLKLAQASTQQ